MLLGAVVDKLPEDYLGKVLQLHPSVKPATILNTVDGRAKDLNLLVSICKASIDAFEVPAYVQQHLN